MPRNPRPTAPRQKPQPMRPGDPGIPEVVDPIWVLKALAVTLAFGLLCAWITVCVLFRYTQWQYVLHPSRNIDSTPTALGIAFTEVHFGVDASGQPQLDGWLIPAERPAAPFALVLHGESGTMADALPKIDSLHAAGLSVLLFDYRGYGRSSGAHPTEASMAADSTTALDYLLTTARVPAGNLFIYGTGVGGSLAVRLCAEHRNLAGLILDTPDGDFESRVAREPSTRMVPVHLFFNQRFPLADPLHSLVTPKLLLSHTGGNAPEEFLRAADPKITVEVRRGRDSASAVITSLQRFVSSNVPQPLMPN